MESSIGQWLPEEFFDETKGWQKLGQPQSRPEPNQVKLGPYATPLLYYMSR